MSAPEADPPRKPVGAAPGPSRRRRLLFGVVANGLVLLFVLLAAEFSVRWYREGSLGGAFGSLFDARPVPRDLGANRLVVPDAEIGFVLNPAMDDVNSLGFVGPELTVPKPPGVLRLLVVGDSVAFDRDGFPSLLASRWGERVEVVNVAVPGYTTYQERLWFARVVGPVAPDVVLLQYCLNDNHQVLHQLDAEGKMLVTQDARRALLPESDGVLAAVGRWSYLAFEVRREIYTRGMEGGDGFPWDPQPAFGPAWRDETWAFQREQLEGVRDLARGAGAELLVVVVPYEPQLDPALIERDRAYVVKPQTELARICTELGVPLVDLHPAFAARHGDALFTDKIHLTPAGHEVASRAIASRLEELGWLRR